MQHYRRPPRYQSYMLRLWQVQGQEGDGPTAWRFSLEDPQSAERRGFPDLESLFAFLRARTGSEDAG